MNARRNGASLLQSFAQEPALIAPEYVPSLKALAEQQQSEGFVANLAQAVAQTLGMGGRSPREDANAVTHDHLCAAMGLGPSDRSKPFAFANGVAVIPMYGALLHRDNWCDSYATGYDFIRAKYFAALADPDVKGIVFDINSGGGHVAGNFELCDAMHEAKGKKPTLGIIDNACYSGAYSLGSTLDRLVCTPSGGAGSIGVVMMHASVEGFLAKHGVEITFIHAGKHKVDGNAFQNLPEDVRERFQARIDASYDKFVSTVARNRGLEADAVRDTQALCFNADDALSRGLIDAVQTPSVALAAFFASLDGSDTNPKTKGASMSKTDETGGAGDAADATKQGTADITTPAAAAPTADAAQAERERCAAITTCEEAKGREELANHFAFKTSMSVDDAKAALAASPKAVAPKADAGAAFNAAMATTPNPDIKADEGGDADTGKQMSAADRIVASHKLATGRK
jgi:signal peptide peptidase SppA